MAAPTALACTVLACMAPVWASVQPPQSRTIVLLLPRFRTATRARTAARRQAHLRLRARAASSAHRNEWASE
ncbi:hypothetical protein PF005_g12047 [Phytophthora fragariae]|uniref:RxLR effector protein n=1 Tax=Phytophthora fragariae TaxID=53985 RepID=A0A6A3EWX4_9STRA|nr:hypothetical protein PF003_g39677 [Phytophthora fragariae]KAE8936856.1 hypothetical protein PF009_g13221 [Phytophthora fragariae]KAE9132481.1 hypothetical protein PF006_g15270 [Phytophthora fragariae]KAE9179569.1 hypothetical protein PF004_g25114 [Phytophthora fragariae]KAE9208860.1 hypothetical protein PF005_g12047 [Phytophthora fragariae]